MAENTNNAPLKVIATTGDRLKDLVIENGQLIFLHDIHRIALDFKGQRTFYNQITEIDSEYDRQNLANPLYGYYFVIDSAVLWLYKNEWIPITGTPNEILFIGTQLPSLGQRSKLYVSTTEKQENISIWDEQLNQYHIVADRTYEITADDIERLFID